MAKRFRSASFWFALILVVCIAAPSSATLWYPSPQPPRVVPGQRWHALFDLEPRTTYTYTLTAYRRGRVSLEGELNLVRTGDEIRVWYTLGRKSGGGSSGNDPTALAGALLLSALQPGQALTLTEVQLLAAPFQFVNWYDLFANGNFSSTVVWETFGHPASTRFQITRSPGWFDKTYEGRVCSGSKTLLEMRIDLDVPLPLHVVTYSDDGDWQFVAELVTPRSTPGFILR